MNPTTPQQAASAAANKKTSSTILERVGMAIFNADHPNDDPKVLDLAWKGPSNFDFQAKYKRIARSALTALLEIDEGTVEAMAKKLHAYDWNDIVKWADETDEVKAQYRERVRFAWPCSINHILSEGGDE